MQEFLVVYNIQLIEFGIHFAGSFHHYATNVFLFIEIPNNNYITNNNR